MPTLSVAVQPPSWAQVGSPLLSPIIAKRTTRRSHTGFYFFAMAVLLGPDGNVVDGGIGGNYISTGVQFDETESTSRPTTVFVFPDLSVSYGGTYLIRLDIYKVSYDNPEGATLDGQIETSSISVVDSEVAWRRPSSSERSFMRKLRNAGFEIPPSPT
ncbi:hypothetical protein G7046_g6955 [Stylonectria norvegica]|nr:hypothetical protein G7046_g6955 [Stylonectria norvegica]